MRNVVSADFFRVHGLRNASVTTCGAWSHTKPLANDLQVVTLTEHNDVIRELKQIDGAAANLFRTTKGK